MVFIYFLIGLSFGFLGLAAYLRSRQEGEWALQKHLPGLAAFGLAAALNGWVEMFLASGTPVEYMEILKILRMLLQPLSGLLLLRFGWGILRSFSPLPAWAVFIPGALIVPIAFAISYAVTTFITPSPLDIPIDIWSRYLLYLPGSMMAGFGFIHQARVQRKAGFPDVSTLLFGAGLGFLVEAFVVGLVVPAAPYSPASYYNYDRVLHNAFSGEIAPSTTPFGLMGWLDYQSVLMATGLPIQFWRLLSAVAVTSFVVKGLDVFDAIRKRQLLALQAERDHAQQLAFNSLVAARQSAENWTEVLVHISRRIAELDDVGEVLLYLVENARQLLHSDFIGLAIYNKSANCLELKYYATAEQTEAVRQAEQVETPLIVRAFQTIQPYRTGEAEPPELLENLCLLPGRVAGAAAVVPICLDITPIGALWMARCERSPYSETDLIWLECLADQVMIAINHGLMTSQLQSLSITEERARIARDMHDGLAQVLGYLNLQVQTLTALLQQGKKESLQKELNEMRQAIQTAHADVRENILSLRTTLDAEKGLVSALEEYIEEFGIQTGVDIDLYYEVEGELNLASIAEVQFICILQESLTNIRKHARARHVLVTIAKEVQAGEEYVYLCIEDDGVGFSMAETHTESKRRFGLKTMRERAQSVHGDLAIESTPEKGTVIECRIPCLKQVRMRYRSPISQGEAPFLQSGPEGVGLP